MALRREIVILFGDNFADEPCQAAGVAQIAVMQEEPAFTRVRIVVDAVQASGVEGAGAPDDSMHFVTFGQKEFREIRAVLSSDAGNERFFRHREREGLAKSRRRASNRKSKRASEGPKGGALSFCSLRRPYSPSSQLRRYF